MEQGALLPHQMPLPREYSLPQDHDSFDQFSGHGQHHSYTNAGAVDQLRRDGTLPQPSPNPFTFATSNGMHVARFVPDGGVASDASSYRSTNNFTDSNPGSFSTSPSSAASSLAYTNHPTNHYTSLPAFSSAAPPPQAFALNSFAGTRAPPISEGATSGGMLPPPNPPRSSISSASHPVDRESYSQATTPYLARPQLSPNSYSSYADTPRSVYPSTGFSPSLGSAGYSAHMASATPQGYGGSQSDCQNFPWPNLEVLSDMTCEGQTVTPEVHAKVEKGFFPSTLDQKWTCYRRNYFSVTCDFGLHPNISNGRMYLKRNNTSEQIQAMGMRLSAAIDGSTGKNIELVQHTTKRDNGPKNPITITKVSPSSGTGRNDHSISPQGVYNMPMSPFHATGTVPGPYLPLQNSNESNGSATQNGQPAQLPAAYGYAGGAHLSIPGTSVQHTFERVQFKHATANNGKRRASQQYFYLIVELFADVRKDNAEKAVWVKVAQRVSDKIVVRGRSPSHYQSEGQHGQIGRGGSTGGGSSYNGTSGGSYGGLNAGGFRSSTGSYGGGIGGAAYRPTQYGMHNSSDDSGGSPESVDGAAMPSDQPMDSVMADSDRASIQEYDGYQYYPSPLYETVSQQLPLPRMERNPKKNTEPRNYAAVKAEYADAVPGAQWQVGGCGRFQGVESSRGYYPDITGSSAGYS